MADQEVSSIMAQPLPPALCFQPIMEFQTSDSDNCPQVESAAKGNNQESPIPSSVLEPDGQGPSNPDLEPLEKPDTSPDLITQSDSILDICSLPDSEASPDSVLGLSPIPARGMSPASSYGLSPVPLSPTPSPVPQVNESSPSPVPVPTSSPCRSPTPTPISDVTLDKETELPSESASTDEKSSILPVSEPPAESQAPSSDVLEIEISVKIVTETTVEVVEESDTSLPETPVEEIKPSLVESLPEPVEQIPVVSDVPPEVKVEPQPPPPEPSPPAQPIVPRISLSEPEPTETDKPSCNIETKTTQQAIAKPEKVESQSVKPPEKDTPLPKNEESTPQSVNGAIQIESSPIASPAPAPPASKEAVNGPTNAELRPSVPDGKRSPSPRRKSTNENGSPMDTRFAASLSEKVALFNQQADRHVKKQELNPFSGANSRSGSKSPRPTFSKDEYGKPPPGSESEYRGIKAKAAMNKDIMELCEVLNAEGELQIVDGTPVKVMCFRDLFQLYTVINDKVVGLLLRARRQGFVDFEGETLFQRRDDDVLIGLIKPIQEIREIMRKRFEELKEEEKKNKEIALSMNIVPNY